MRCDNYGLVVNDEGIIVKCLHCGGRKLTNQEIKDAKVFRPDN